MKRTRPIAPAVTVMLSAAVVTLMGCSAPPQDTAAPSTPSTSTVHVDPAEHDHLDPAATPDTAPVLTWKDRDTLIVSTLESSTPTCQPTPVTTVDADGALAVRLDYDQATLSQGCDGDASPWSQELPLPDGIGQNAVVRLSWGEGTTRPSSESVVYEYEMGTVRPA